jgi:anti-sigma factor RsiW
MKCPEARELLSALLDDALSASERQAIEAHLAACAECRRELEALRGTVTLLGRLPPVHAPAGFVDRVMDQAYRPSWPRRVVAALFRPLRVKLPLEAAAVVLVGISALYVYQRAPEVQQVAREETREAPPPAQPPAPPAAPSVADGSGSAGTRAQEAASQPQSGEAEQGVRQEPGPSEGTPPVTPAAPPPALQRENAVTAPASPGATAPGTAPEPKVAAKAESKKEAFDQRAATR